MAQVEASGKPLTSLLQQISSLTGGRSRKLDMGSAKAAAQHINAAVMEEMSVQLASELELVKRFEVAYGKRLNMERSHLGAAPSGSAAGGNTAARPSFQHVTARVSTSRGQDGAPKAIVQARPRGDSLDSGPQLLRPSKAIPPIPKSSTLLRSTAARRNYFDSMIVCADEAAGHANDVSQRASGYPATGPGPMRPASTAWDRLRHKGERSKARQEKKLRTAQGAMAAAGGEPGGSCESPKGGATPRHARPPSAPALGRSKTTAARPGARHLLVVY